MHAFLSYVRDDAVTVERLANALIKQGVNVWLDRTHIVPGQRWRERIRSAIREGDLFIACFSRAYAARDRSHMNEELLLAIDELRLRPASRSWFIPVLLDDTEIPDLSISSRESLRDLQWVDLATNWDNGIDRIARVALGNNTSEHTNAAGISMTARDTPRTPEMIGINRHPILKLKNFVRSVGLAQHGWAKTFSTLNPEFKNMTVNQIIDNLFSTNNRDHLHIYLESVKYMYQVSPQNPEVFRHFQDVCRAFGIEYDELA